MENEAMWLVLIVGILCCSLQGARSRGEKTLYRSVAEDVQFPAFDLSESTWGMLRCTFYGENKSTHVAVFDYSLENKKVAFTTNYGNRSNFNTSNGSFQLRNLNKEDAGDYEFELIGNSSRTTVIHLQILEAVSTPQITSNSNLMGSDIVLQCNASGDDMTYTWKKDGKDFPSRYSLQDNDMNVLITDANASDSGQFSCTVQNAVSNQTTEFTLSLKEKTPESRSHRSIVGLVIAIAIVMVILMVIVIVYVIYIKKKQGNEAAEQVELSEDVPTLHLDGTNNHNPESATYNSTKVRGFPNKILEHHTAQFAASPARCSWLEVSTCPPINKNFRSLLQDILAEQRGKSFGLAQ